MKRTRRCGNVLGGHRCEREDGHTGRHESRVVIPGSLVWWKGKASL